MSIDVINAVKEVAEVNPVRVYLGDEEIFTDFDDLSQGRKISLIVSSVQSSTGHIAQNMDALLSYQEGIFLSSSRPKEWYLIDEKFMSGEKTDNPIIAAYGRLPAFIAFLKDTFDFSAPDQTREKLLILAGKKTEVPIIYKASDLTRFPKEEQIELVRDDILSPPRVLAKKELFKRSAARFLENISIDARFASLMSEFETITRSYEADRDNFFSEFEFEKLSEQFERKRHEFMLKIDAVCGDLLTKVLAVPIGQAIVVSQYRDGAQFGNVALVAGSAIFTLVGVAYVLNQVHSIGEIRSNARRERQEIEIKYPTLHKRVSKTYDAILTRVNLYGRALPALVTILLLVGFLVSLAGFNRVVPCGGCVDSAISWVMDLVHGLYR